MPLSVSARLLILDNSSRLLLAKYLHDHHEHDLPFWAAIGGNVEPGETLADAAIREAKEETGIDVALGPAVWYAEHEFKIAGTLYRFQETFFVAHLTDEGSFSCGGRPPLDQKTLMDMRWWTLDEIIHAEELVYPISLPEHLPQIIRGEYPEKPITIEA